MLFAVAMLLISALLLSTASFAWFSMNTAVNVSGIEFEAYSDSLFLQISNKADEGFASSILTDNDKKSLRPIALGSLNGGAYKTAFVRAEGNYSEKLGVNYFLRVEKGEDNDSRGKCDYVCVNSKLYGASRVDGYYNATDGQIAFSVVTSGEYRTGVYYEKQRNAYVPVTLSVGDSLYGYFTVSVKEACSEGAEYENGNLYYELGDDGGYYPVGGLRLGSSLDGYYVVSSEKKADVAEKGIEYFIKNQKGDYISLGQIAEGTRLDGSYSFWYRGYSSELGKAEPDGVTAIIEDSKYPQKDENPYYLYDTLYLRMAPGGSNGANLRVSGVTLDGKDSQTSAVRVLFVATNGRGEVAYASYDASAEEKIKHLSGEVLFGELLGGAAEVIRVELYVYYDGRSESVKTGRDVVLSGHKLGVSFSIDKPYYAEYMQ